jgi:hypothetical protein
MPSHDPRVLVASLVILEALPGRFGGAAHIETGESLVVTRLRGIRQFDDVDAAHAAPPRDV